jgi:hypothetical protein
MGFATLHPSYKFDGERMLMQTLKRSFTAVVTALALAGCAPLLTQSPGGALSPVNAIADGEDKHLMLFGADVVAYFTEGKHRQGDPAIKSVRDGVTFRFANGIVYGIPYGGNADAWRIIDGRLYTFGGAGSRDGFYLDLKRNIALADKYWAEEVNQSNAFVQRVKRLVFRVPHYLTGPQLREAVARSKDKT